MVGERRNIFSYKTGITSRERTREAGSGLSNLEAFKRSLWSDKSRARPFAAATSPSPEDATAPSSGDSGSDTSSGTGGGAPADAGGTGVTLPPTTGRGGRGRGFGTLSGEGGSRKGCLAVIALLGAAVLATGGYFGKRMYDATVYGQRVMQRTIDTVKTKDVENGRNNSLESAVELLSSLRLNETEKGAASYAKERDAARKAYLDLLEKRIEGAKTQAYLGQTERLQLKKVYDTTSPWFSDKDSEQGKKYTALGTALGEIKPVDEVPKEPLAQLDFLLSREDISGVSELVGGLRTSDPNLYKREMSTIICSDLSDYEKKLCESLRGRAFGFYDMYVRQLSGLEPTKGTERAHARRTLERAFLDAEAESAALEELRGKTRVVPKEYKNALDALRAAADYRLVREYLPATSAPVAPVSVPAAPAK